MGPVDIQGHGLQQLRIAHLRQHGVGAGLQDIVGKVRFFLDQGVDLLFDGAPANKFVHHHVAMLTDAEGPVVAWFSTAGFHQRSKWITCEAAVRLRPVPPALRESTKNGGPSSCWNLSISARRFFTAVSAVQDKALLAEYAPRKAAIGSVISRNWGKHQHFFLA